MGAVKAFLGLLGVFCVGFFFFEDKRLKYAFDGEESPFPHSPSPRVEREMSEYGEKLRQEPNKRRSISAQSGISKKERGKLPTVARSYVFANNKGGVGKSTILFNLASEYARRNPNVNVLVVDLSLYADTSTLLMGGTQKEDGMQRGRLRIQRLPKSRKAASLLKDLLKFAEECRLHKSWWPNRQWFRRQIFDFARHAHPLKDHSTDREHVPPNLFLCAGSPELREVLSPENWGDACYALRRSMEAELYDPELSNVYGPGIPEFVPGTEGNTSPLRQWVLFFDTDHEIHTPHAKLALGCAERLIIPMTIDENDFDRLFVHEIALFPILSDLYEQGVLRARVDMLIFNRVQKYSVSPFDDNHVPVRLAFTPTKSDLNQMKKLCQDLHVRYLAGMHQLFLDADSVGSSFQRFMRRFVSAFAYANPVYINQSKKKGIPLTQMPEPNTQGKTYDQLSVNVESIIDDLESHVSGYIDPSMMSSVDPSMSRASSRHPKFGFVDK